MDLSRVEALVQRAQGGDRDAWSKLYGQLAPRVFGLCHYLLGSPEAAEDARNEVFLRVQRAMNTYNGTVPFPQWVLSIASHLCIDQLRRRRVERRLFDPSQSESVEAVAPSPSALSELLGKEQRQMVRTALESLPERYRLPLTLRYYNEMSYDEIAESLRLSRNNVATLIFRGKKELRRALERTPKEIL